MYREGLLERVLQPAVRRTCRRRRSPSTAHYVADRFNFFTIAYNTNLVKPNEVPNSYEDLLNPQLGRAASASRRATPTGSARWSSAMGEEKGLAFFRKLADMKPQMRTGHTLMAELVASGEIPLAATIYNHNAERLKVKGAPIKWKALSPTFGRPNGDRGGEAGAAAARRAAFRRLHALPRRARSCCKERNRVPASDKVDTNLNKFPFQMIDPVVVLDEAGKWEKLWSELFLKGRP